MSDCITCLRRADGKPVIGEKFTGLGKMALIAGLFGIVIMPVVSQENTANAEYIDVIQEPVDLIGNGESFVSTPGSIQTYDNHAFTSGYDSGADILLNKTFGTIPDLSNSKVFCTYSSLGTGLDTSNVDLNKTFTFQDGESYTMHFSIRDGPGGGGYVDMNIKLADYEVALGTDVSYNVSMDTNGDDVFDSFSSGLLSSVGEGNNLWRDNVFISDGLDVRNTSTSTGVSEHFGKIDFNVSSIPEPSMLTSLLIGGGVGAFALRRRRVALASRQC